MIRPRIRIINRCGFLAYRVMDMPTSIFSNSVIWFEGKRYLSAGESSIFFRPGRQPAFKPRLRDLAAMVNTPKILT